VRKHLSTVKGGRLALAAYPASVAGLLISDVAGDDPASIASGPTVPDPTTREEARQILDRYGIPVPRAVADWLGSHASESPKPGDPRFARVRNEVIASNRTALELDVRFMGGVFRVYDVVGEARHFAHKMAEMMRGVPALAPLLWLSGDETAVTIRGTGRGGRNTEFLLALAIELNDAPNVWALACDTDGIDGTEDNAGAILTPDTLARARSLGLDPEAMLANNDSYSFFEALNDLVRVGPTRTNVSDFRAVLVLP
jgi:hydroxypyruvate reductase